MADDADFPDILDVLLRSVNPDGRLDPAARREAMRQRLEALLDWVNTVDLETEG